MKQGEESVRSGLREDLQIIFVCQVLCLTAKVRSSPPKASSVPPSPPKATSGQATPKASPGQTSQQAIPEPVRQDPSVSDGTKLLVERLVSEILKGLQTDPATGELRVSSDGLTQQITTAFQSL